MPLADLDFTILEYQINELRKDSRNWRNSGTTTMLDFKKDMGEKYKYLYEKSEGLFNKSINGELETEEAEARMLHMLSLLKTAQNGKRSKEAVEKQFGQEMFNKHVQPIIDNIDDAPAVCNVKK